MLRGLVLSPQEMHPLRVKFSSMCRKQGKNSMSRAVLQELLSLPANSDLVRAKAPFDKPLLVLALAKQLYQDDHKDEAIRALEDLANHWNKRINPIPKATGRELIPPSTKEPARICAKVLLKLGEWTELKSKTSNNMVFFIFNFHYLIVKSSNFRGYGARSRNDENFVATVSISILGAALSFFALYDKIRGDRI